MYYSPIETKQGGLAALVDRTNLMTSYKSGTIRKNASKKIDAILALATSIEYNHYSLDMYSDCWVYENARQVNAEFVKKFIEDNYSKIDRIYLHCDANGHPKELYVSAFRGYFNITFAPVQVEDIEVNQVEDKPRMSYAAVKAFLKAGFVSPLNNSVVASSDLLPANGKVMPVQNELLPGELKEVVKPASEFYHFVKTMIIEKGRDLDCEIKLPGHYGFTYDMLLTSLDSMPEYRNKIKSNLSHIDLKNGDIFHFLDYLARGIAGELVIN